MPPVNDAIEPRIKALEEKVSRMEEQVCQLGEDLRGTASQPGAFELIRTTSASVAAMERNVSRISDVLETYKQDRNTLRGAIIVVGLISGFLSWLTTWVIGYWKGGN